jgi:hypothetical protein
MSALYLFIAILVVLFISIIFAIVNWIFQAKISSRIGHLEEELEKRNLEFDLFRKERISAQVSARTAPAMEMSPQMDMPLSQQTVDDGSIQIVRNVRGTFEPANPGAEAFPSPTNGEHLGGAASAEPGRPWSPEPVARGTDEVAAIDDTKRWANAGLQKQPAETMPRPPTPAAAPPRPPIAPFAGVTIQLFSRTSSAADLNFLYTSLMKILKTRTDRIIGIDCAGVQSLSDQEIEYLEKLCWSLKGQNREVVFSNCSSDLIVCLQRRPSLASLIR